MSRYLTNKLIRHRLLQKRQARRSPALLRRDHAVLIQVSLGYPPLSGRFLCITHPSATSCTEVQPVRLACVRHAASVQSEPGSNSPIKPNWSVSARTFQPQHPPESSPKLLAFVILTTFYMATKREPHEHKSTHTNHLFLFLKSGKSVVRNS